MAPPLRRQRRQGGLPVGVPIVSCVLPLGAARARRRSSSDGSADHPATTLTRVDDETRGARLGLPAAGPGSLAPLSRRVVALFLDWGASWLIALAVDRDAGDGAPTWLPLLVFALEVALLTWLGGGSFGQRLVGIRVVGLQRRLGPGGAALRTLLIVLVVPPLVWDADGRGLHDRALGSAVVRAPRS